MKVYYLDTSIVIPYIATVIGTRKQRWEPNNIKALQFISKARARLKVSAATYAEVLRHFPNADAVDIIMAETFDPPLPLTARHARRWARMQNRSGRVMGDNDAWVAAQAIEDGGAVVGHDKNAFHDRPDVEYIDFLKA